MRLLLQCSFRIKGHLRRTDLTHAVILLVVKRCIIPPGGIGISGVSRCRNEASMLLSWSILFLIEAMTDRSGALPGLSRPDRYFIGCGAQASTPYDTRSLDTRAPARPHKIGVPRKLRLRPCRRLPFFLVVQILF
jgi:hypothetical protein